MMRKIGLPGLSLALPMFLLTATFASAQTAPLPPGAGAGQADPSSVGAGLIERGDGLAPPRIGTEREATIDDRSKAAPRAAAPGAQLSFRLEQVRFGASTFVTPAELEAIAAPLIGTTVTFDDLAKLLDRINARFAAQGAVTVRAVLPPQEIAGGVVRIDIVEGRVGTQSVTSPGYTPEDYVASRVRLPQGAVVDMADLRRRISGFNRTNDAQLRAELQAGATTGLTDIRVSVVDVPRTGLQLFIDNNAYESTGRAEAGLSLRRNQLFQPGDRATLFASASEGALTAVGAYSAPVGDLLRLGVSYAHSDIKVIRGPFAGLGVTGRSDTIVGSLARPIVIGETYGVAAQGSYTLIRSVNDVAAQTVGDVVVGKAALGLNGFVVGAVGQLRFDAGLAHASVDTRVGLDTPDFLQLTGSADYTSADLGGFVIRTALSGQYADRRDVPGSQVYQLGGISSVRGYEPGAVSGYAGYLASFELHRNVPLSPGAALDAYAFADAGRAFYTGGRQSIASLGVGVNAALTPRLLMQGVYARGLRAVGAKPAGDRIELRLAYTFG